MSSNVIKFPAAHVPPASPDNFVSVQVRVPADVEAMLFAKAVALGMSVECIASTVLSEAVRLASSGE